MKNYDIVFQKTWFPSRMNNDNENWHQYLGQPLNLSLGFGEYYIGNATANDILENMKDIKKYSNLNVSLYMDEVLPALPNNIKTLTISRSSILKQITKLPSNLTILKISYIKTLDTTLLELPTSLKLLEINSCKLKELPTLPEGITDIDFQNNQIESIPSSLPPSLTSMNFNNNNISHISSFPPNLQFFYAWDNPIQTIPRLPSTIEEIEINPDTMVEPFRSIIQAYHNVDFMNSNKEKVTRELIESVNSYWDTLAGQAKNIRALQLVSKNGSFTRVKENGEEQVIPNVTSLIGSFLSGKEGTLPKQMNQLKKNLGKGGKRNSRKTRKRKTAKKLKQ